MNIHEIIDGQGRSTQGAVQPSDAEIKERNAINKELQEKLGGSYYFDGREIQYRGEFITARMTQWEAAQCRACGVPESALGRFTQYLACGYGPAGAEKATRIVHSECRAAYAPTAHKLHLTWFTTYHLDAPFDLVSRFALCAYCNTAIRRDTPKAERGQV